MKIIATIFPADLVTNLLFILSLSFPANQKQESGCLVTRNILLFLHSELRSTSKPCQIQWTFIKEFSYMLFLFVL